MVRCLRHYAATGATSILTLILHVPICLPGFGAYYVLAANSYECTACPPGTALDHPGTHACTLCAPGHHQSGVGELQCVACQPGSFAPTDGLAVCELCASDTASGAGSAECREKPMEVWPFIAAAVITVVASIFCLSLYSAHERKLRKQSRLHERELFDRDIEAERNFMAVT